MIVQDNTPSTGFISWQNVNITYKGQTYKIADGNTNLMYIYWKYSDPLAFYGANVFPVLAEDDLLVFLNKQGIHLTVPKTTIIDGSLIVPESIMTNGLSAKVITTEKIATGAVTADTIAANAIGADKIAANAVIAGKIAANAVTSTTIAADAITATHIAVNAVTASEIAANAVTSSELAANSVIAGKIAANAVTAATVAANAIGANHIATNTITANKMAIADFTNLAQIDAESFPNGYTTVDISNLSYFKVGPAAYGTLTLAQSKTQEFKVGDEYFFGGIGYKEAAVGKVNAIIRYYYSDGSWSNAGVAVVPFTATSAQFGFNLKITADADPLKTLSRVDFFFEKDSTTTGYYYARQLEIRKRYTGELIVDGSITAKQLTVTDLSAITSNLGSIKGGDLSITNTPLYEDGTTFVQMKNGEIFVTNVNPDTISRANADDLHITDGGMWMVGHDANDIAEYELDLMPKTILFTELNTNGSIRFQTLLRAEFVQTPKVITDVLEVNNNATINAMLTLNGPLNINGSINLLGSYTDLDMNNNIIKNVDQLTFNDPGPSEGIIWQGGNGWRIVEARDDMTNVNTPGNIQIAQGPNQADRRFSFNTYGDITSYGSDGGPVGLWDGGSIGIVDTTGGYVNFYVRSAVGGEVRLTEMGSNTAYTDLRASGVNVNSVNINTGTHLYLRAAAAGGEVRVTAAGSTTTYAKFRAGTVYYDTLTASSNATRKKNITEYKGDALYEILTTPIREYHYIDDSDTEKKRLGIVLQEAPADVADIRGEGVETYAMITLAWKALQELNETLLLRNAELRKKNDELEKENKQLRGEFESSIMELTTIIAMQGGMV